MSKKITALLDRTNNEQVLTKAREAARTLWLFGLGAYSLASKSSVQTVETLLREGKAIQPRALRQIEEKSAGLRNTASATIQRGERLVKERFFRPLDFVLLATRRDIEQLSLRVIQLSDEVHRLATGKTRPMAPALKKPAIKPAAATATSAEPPMMASPS